MTSHNLYQPEPDAQTIYRQHLKRGKLDLAAAVGAGMLPKETLADGTWYEGYCRNARLARWNGTKARFEYIRSKFGSRFWEDIVHPADDEQFDIFVPVRKLEQAPPDLI